MLLISSVMRFWCVTVVSRLLNLPHSWRIYYLYLYYDSILFFWWHEQKEAKCVFTLQTPAQTVFSQHEAWKGCWRIVWLYSHTRWIMTFGTQVQPTCVQHRRNRWTSWEGWKKNKGTNISTFAISRNISPACLFSISKYIFQPIGHFVLRF